MDDEAHARDISDRLTEIADMAANKLMVSAVIGGLGAAWQDVPLDAQARILASIRNVVSAHRTSADQMPFPGIGPEYSMHLTQLISERLQELADALLGPLDCES